jgi:hypothetical protein
MSLKLFCIDHNRIMRVYFWQVCDINAPIFQLYIFLLVYKSGFNAYAICKAKDTGKKVDQKIIDENGLPLSNMVIKSNLKILIS